MINSGHSSVQTSDLLCAKLAESDAKLAVSESKLAEAMIAIGRNEQRIALLCEQIRLLRIKKYGPKGEHLSAAQCALFDLEPSFGPAEVEAEAALDPAAKELKRKLPPKKQPVRGPLPAHWPREEIIIPCPEAQCHCAQCGAAKKLIGYETSERISVKPAKYFVEVTKREKLACAKCEEMGVSVAPVPPRIIEKGILSDRFVVDVIIKKYCEHAPFYRQAFSIERDTDVILSQATLSSSVLKAGDLLKDVTGAMRDELLATSYLQADETTVGVQSKLGKGKNHRAYFWQYGRPGGSVVFEFRMGRERAGPARFLAGYDGRLQCDGYPAYKDIGSWNIVFFGCFAHARRKFVEASQLDAADVRSVAIVAKIAKLYEVEQDARDRQLDAAGREALRAERSVPLLAELKAMILKVRPEVLPQSVFGKACAYAINQWERLERYAGPGNGEVEIDNNWAENGMRGIALGRKNWMQIGSEEAGPKVAAILSIVETCKRLKIKVRDYFEDVLPKLSYWSTRLGTGPKSFADLTPAAWQRARKQAQSDKQSAPVK